MKSFNLLISSAGRRVELIRKFKEARQRLKIKSDIVAIDSSIYAPAIYCADKHFIVPKVDDNEFIPTLIEICNNNNISLIIPTIDTELSVFSQRQDEIERLTPSKVLISGSRVIDICNDKYKTHKFFKENNFSVPELITQEKIHCKDYKFPLIIKPYNGSSSKYTFKVDSDEELEFYGKHVPNPIIQEFIFGDEYTIDVLTDFESNPITVVPRRRLEVRGGEISKGIIIKDKNIINEVKKIVEALMPIGPVTIQCIKNENDIKFIEINARFGGGCPMSITAGSNAAENIYRLLKGEKLEYSEKIIEYMVSLRYDCAVYIDIHGNPIA